MGGIWRQGVAESPVTMTILAVTIGLWILHVVLKAVFHLDTDATLAGNGRLGTDGQWWRLITPVVVHFGLVHLAFNMAWLYQLGPPIERVMGRAPFAVTYAATGVAGNIASDWYYYGQNVRSGGASGAIYGLGGVLVGAYVAASFLKRRHPGPPRPGTLRFNDQMVRSLAILFGVYLVFGTLLHVDSAAHAGGGVLGLAVGGVVAWRRNRPAKVVAS
jgi:rhomboid protease GluP